MPEEKKLKTLFRVALAAFCSASPFSSALAERKNLFQVQNTSINPSLPPVLFTWGGKQILEVQSFADVIAYLILGQTSVGVERENLELLDKIIIVGGQKFEALGPELLVRDGHYRRLFFMVPTSATTDAGSLRFHA